MARLNEEVQALLEEYAELLTITGGDAFRARAYEKAARSVGGHHTDIATLDAKELRQIPGVGASTADKIDEYRRTGTVQVVEALREKVPPGVRQLMAIPSVGPKKALALYQDLHITSAEELAEAIGAKRLRGVPGFGERSEEILLRGLELMRQAADRTQLDVATALADEIVSVLGALPGCERCTWAGSLRRMRETVGDLDILAAAEDPAPLMAALTELPYVRDVIAHGTTKTSVRTDKGLQVDLRVVPAEDWGAALIYFTGSKAHNVKLRARAVKAGLKLSEYGLFDAESGKKIVSETEEEVYAALGLPWIPPALREDRGEIQAALRGELPHLVTETDLRGDLHTHTDLTDGVAPLEQMLAVAAERGYAYYAVTDHAPNLIMQRMTEEKMLRQRRRLRDLAASFRGMRLLHGTELNIDPDGGVDWPAEFLAGFDVCVASVHSHFGADRDAQTRRLIRACENPHVHIIGHPTTRLIGRRGEIDVDLDAVFQACVRTGTAMEINSSPHRLDLRDEHIRRAKQLGVRFAADSDAHAPAHLGYPRYGIGTAQRGGLTADDVINAWPWERLRNFLRGGERRDDRGSAER